LQSEKNAFKKCLEKCLKNAKKVLVKKKTKFLMVYERSLERKWVIRLRIRYFSH